MSCAPLASADPTSVGEYTLLGRLGAGGMGTVYLGRDRAGAMVAVKLVHEHLAADPQFVERLVAEAAAARRVAGFCTARVVHAQVHGPRPFLVTEYVDGPTLESVLSGGGPLPASQVEALAVGVAAALTAIHAAGVVHRDLKPSNVMLSTFGLKVIDFGVAKALDGSRRTEAGLVFGTPGWMAPEHLSGAVTAASDVFVWGLLVARAGTAWRPAPNPLPVLPTPAELAVLPPSLAAAVSAALHQDPARRPSARDLLLRLCGSTQPTAVRTATAVLSRPWDPSYTAVPPPRQPPPSRQPTPRQPTARQPRPSQQRSPLPLPLPLPLQRPRPPQQLPARQPQARQAPAQQPRPPSQLRPPLPQQRPPHAVVAPRRRRWYRRKRVLLLLAVLVALLLNESAERNPAADLPPLTARDGILEFTVTGVECGTSPVGTPGLARRPQGQLCQVRLRVRNFGSDVRRVHVGSQKLYDGTGRQFRADDGAWVYLPESVPFFREEVNPGNQVSATLVFDIAAGAEAARLEVHDSPLSGGASITL